MRTDTPVNAILVSCDIIGHGETGSHDEQLARLRALYDCIRGVCRDYFATSAIWASGGDGGHMAFVDPAHAPVAIRLLEALFVWAHGGAAAGRTIDLRLTVHFGPVAVVDGADGRDELVGDGINTCGSLLKFGEPETVLATAEFRDFIRARQSNDALLQRLKFGAERRIYLKHSRSTSVMPLSVEGSFISRAGGGSVHSDRVLLQQALKASDSWSIIYHAKRLLQVNSSDPDAVGALQALTPGQLVVSGPNTSRIEAHPLLSQMNRQAVHDLVRSAQLVERDHGELICAQDDTGDAMFIIVKGRIGVAVAEAPAAGGERTAAPLDLSFAPGQVVGELALALNRRRTATLQAVGRTAFLSISYATLRGLFEAKQANPRLQRAFNEFLLERSLRFLCTSCPYLAKGADAPLAGIAQPWETMVGDSEYMNFDWHEAEVGLADNKRFALPGLYILAGGRLIEATPNEAIAKRLDSQSLPIVLVDLPNLVSSNRPYQIDTEGGATINIVRISESALKSFGPAVHNKLIAAIRRQLAQQFLYDVFISYSHRDEHIVATWYAALEQAGFRVYMGRPDAMNKFKPEIELALAESLVMLPFVSDRAERPDGQPGWVEREIAYRKTLFDEDHCNILPIELTAGLSGKFADGFSAIVVGGDGSAAKAEAIDAIRAVREGKRAPPFAAKRAPLQRI